MVKLVLFVALESLNFGLILLLKSRKKSTKLDQGCPRGGQNWSKGVPTPQRFRKTGREQEHHRREKLFLLELTWVRKSPPKKRLAANSVKNIENKNKKWYIESGMKFSWKWYMKLKAWAGEKRAPGRNFVKNRWQNGDRNGWWSELWVTFGRIFDARDQLRLLFGRCQNIVNKKWPRGEGGR